MGKSVTLVLVLVLAASSSILGVLSVEGESRTIVVPDEYPTIFAAVENAVDGDTVSVKTGTCEGPINKTLIISKAISIIGENPKTTMLSLHPEWVTKTICGSSYSYYSYPIKIEANDVRISGLTINSDGGEVLANGSRTQITGNIFRVDVLLSGSYQLFAENTIIEANVFCSGTYDTVTKNNVHYGTIQSSSGSYDEIYQNDVVGCIFIGGMSNHESVYDNIVRDGDNEVVDGIDSYSSGIVIASSRTTVTNNIISNCSTGISHISGSNNHAHGNIIKNIRGPALKMIEGSNFTFIQNYVANNLVGVQIDSDTFTMYHNSFINNDLQIKILDDRVHFWSMDNGEEGNYWSDYNGEDADGDGIGDSQYFVKNEIVDRFPLMAPFDNGNNPVSPSPTPSLSPLPSPSPSSSPQEPSPSSEPEPQPEPLPIEFIAAASGFAAIIGLSLLVYFKKRKH